LISECSEDCLNCLGSANFCIQCVNLISFLNTRAGTCTFCPENTYNNFGKCDPCPDICSPMCPFKRNCFECAQDKYMDIESRTCIDTCEGIIAEGPRFGNLKWCWSYQNTSHIQIYINPSSNQPLELGSFEYPYWLLQNAIWEINYLINNKTNVDLDILFAEKNQHDIRLFTIFIERLNSVRLSSYSTDRRISA